MRIINLQEVTSNTNNINNKKTYNKAMDENTLSHQNGSVLGGSNAQNTINSNNMNNKSGVDESLNANSNNTAQYTIPGVLHFIQHEWARFELERSQWDVDRAELQVSFCLLKTFQIDITLFIHYYNILMHKTITLNNLPNHQICRLR